jgi:glycosyltransferase involved in cell wall biosynthesis
MWLNSPFDPLPGEGGRPLRYWLLARALAAAGHDVVWWSSDFHHVRKAPRELPALYRADESFGPGFEVRLVPTQPYATNVGLSRWRSHAAYARAFEVHAREAVATGVLAPPDVILVTLPPLGLFDAAARLRARWGCRAVLDVQDAWPENFQQLLPGFVKPLGPALLWPLHRIASRAYRGADAVSVVSDSYTEFVRKAGRTTDPAVFRLGISLPPPPPVTRGQGESLRLAYIGSLGVSYDITTVLRSVEESIAAGDRISLDIAGDGALRSAVEAAEARTSGAVRFHGYLNDDALRQLLGQCDVGIVPMFSKSLVALPNKLADYAAAGLAIINGLSGEAAALLSSHGCGIQYEPGNVASLSAALGHYASNRSLVSQHASASRLMAEHVFDAERIYPAMAEWLAANARQRRQAS